MTENEMKDILLEGLDALEEKNIEYEQDHLVISVDDLQNSGYLTNDTGLVVTLADGRKYIVTVQEVE